MMDSHEAADREFQEFFRSIGLESWIRPLTDLGVSSLKFLYLNFDDIIDEEEISCLRQNRLHVKIITKKLKAKFEYNSQDSTAESVQNLNNSCTYNGDLIVPKQEPITPPPLLSPQSYPPNTVPEELCTALVGENDHNESMVDEGNVSLSQFHMFDMSKEEKFPFFNPNHSINVQMENCNPNPRDISLEEAIVDFGNGMEKVLKLIVPQPQNPKENRFIEDWKTFGQIRFFDTANFIPNVPKGVVETLQILSCNQPQPLSGKDFESCKETLCQNLFVQMMHYFVWRWPQRLAHTVVDRLIQLYPCLDDGTPTKTDSIKKRIFDKYALFRRYKLPPDWVQNKYLSLNKFPLDETTNGSHQPIMDSNGVIQTLKRKRKKRKDEETLTINPMNQSNDQNLNDHQLNTTMDLNGGPNIPDQHQYSFERNLKIEELN